MAIVCKYVNPPKAVDDAEKTVKELMPLLHEYWEKWGKLEYGDEEFSLNLLSFIQMWKLGSLAIFIAYDNDEPVGFLMGVRFRPMFYDANAFQVQDWYARTPEVQDVLFKYLQDVLHLMNIHEVFTTENSDKDLVPYRLVSTQQYKRYII